MLGSYSGIVTVRGACAAPSAWTVHTHVPPSHSLHHPLVPHTCPTGPAGSSNMGNMGNWTMSSFKVR